MRTYPPFYGCQAHFCDRREGCLVAPGAGEGEKEVICAFAINYARA